LDDIRPLRKLAASNGTIAKNVTLFPAPDAYQVQYRAAPGYEWSTFGLWDAANRSRGAAVSFFVNKLAVRKDTARKTDSAATAPAPRVPGMGGRNSQAGQTDTRAGGDSAMVKIYNDKDELIRTTKWKVDSGFNRAYWGMEEKGFRQPGSPKPRPGAPEPGGFQVLPGTYKLVLTYNRESDSTYVTVKDDPRLGNRNAVKIAQRAMFDRLKKSADKLTQGMDRLIESEEVLTKMTTQLKDLEGKDADSLRRTTKAMQDSIKAIREFINGKPSDKQGINRDPGQTVMRTIQLATQYIASKSLAPGPQEETLVQNAEMVINQAVQRINTFYNTKWKEYRLQVEGTKLNLFKDYNPL
jgi:hypothetical protein